MFPNLSELDGKQEKMKFHCLSKIVIAGMEIVLLIFNHLNIEEIDDYNKRLLEYIFVYFRDINEHDVSFNNYEQYLKILQLYKRVTSGFAKPKGARIFEIEEAAIVVNLRFLSSTLFDRKYQAIKMLTTRVENSTSEKIKDRSRELLLKHKILDILFISGYHHEIAMRANGLLAFLAPALTSEVFIRLLKNAFDESAEKGGVLCKTIEKMVGSLSIEVYSTIIY